MKYLLSILYIVFICLLANGQDAQFSQFFNTSGYNNAATAGVFNGNDRVVIAYRDQWSSIVDGGGFKTFMASYDHKIWFGSNTLTLGALVLRDQVASDQFSQTLAQFNIAYNLQLSGSKYQKNGFSQYLSAGFNAGLGQYNLKSRDVWFGNQYDIPNAVVDQSIDALESGVGETLSSGFYPDFGLGLMYYALMGKYNSVYAGASLQHVNNPNISLIDNGNAVQESKWSINAGGEIAINEEGLSIMPSVIYLRQGASTQIIGGTQLRYTQRSWNDVGLRLGLFTRLTDSSDGSQLEALIWTATLEFGATQIAFSYDTTLSNLNEVNRNRGAFELNLIYKNASKDRRVSIDCPRF